MVHRDLKLENILLAENPHDFNDKLYIKVSGGIIQINRQIQLSYINIANT